MYTCNQPASPRAKSWKSCSDSLTAFEVASAHAASLQNPGAGGRPSCPSVITSVKRGRRGGHPFAAETGFAILQVGQRAVWRAPPPHPTSCKSAGLGYRRSAFSSRNSIHAFRNLEPLHRLKSAWVTLHLGPSSCRSHAAAARPRTRCRPSHWVLYDAAAVRLK